jgi:Glycosyl transferase family 2
MGGPPFSGSHGDHDRPEVSVVLPCLNEAGAVGLCVAEALEALRAHGIRGEVLVVDNGSTDGSSEVAARAGATVVVEPRRGYGIALRTGVAASRGAFVVMADADFTYDLSRLTDLVQPIRDGRADLVVASRLASGSRRSIPYLHRRIGTPAITFLLARACGGLGIRDSQSGFRAFRREAIIGLGLTSAGMEYASEMLVVGASMGLVVTEVSVPYRARIGESKLNALGDGWRHVQLILLIAPHLLLVWPGAAMLLVGTATSVLAFLTPSGVVIGSLRWQPIFFSTILLVLGVQSLLAGMVLAHRSSVMLRRVPFRYQAVADPSFASRCFGAGTLALVVGLAIDLLEFLTWVGGGIRGRYSLALASLAQSLLLIGGTLVTFSIVYRLVLRRSASEGVGRVGPGERLHPDVDLR